MKKLILFTLLMSAVVLTFPATSHAKEEAPDFTFGDFACVITSEENAEVAIYYYNEDDFTKDSRDFEDIIDYDVEVGSLNVIERCLTRDNLKRCEERKLIFPAKVEWQGKIYTVTSLYPYIHNKDKVYTDNFGIIRDYESWIAGITEVELPSTLKYMPDVNPLKHYRDLCRISLQEGNEYFKAEDGSLYSADGTILYAVPRMPDNISLFKGNENVLKLHPDAFYKTVIGTYDFSQMKNLEPSATSFFDNFSYLRSYWNSKLYYPPTVIFDAEAFKNNPDIYYYLPSSINDVKTGYIRGADSLSNILYWLPCYIETYFNEEENLIINDGFICVNKGRRLVAYSTYNIPFRTFDENGSICLANKFSLPEGIEQIASDLFSSPIVPSRLTCPYILPFSLKSIEDYTFEGYNGTETQLTSFGGHTSFVTTEVNGTLFSRDAEGNEIKNMLPEKLETMGKGCFMRSMLKEITVPNVKYIPELAFAGCKQLEKITFGAGVEQIELSALFVGVPIPDTDEIRLTPETCVIECLSTTPPQLLSTDFDADQTFNNTVIVPDEAFEAYKEAWGDKFPNILTVSGINAVSADNTDSAEIFYNLNGQRVDGRRDTLAPGLYICRKAGSVEKIIIK